VNGAEGGAAGKLAIPTADHWYPFLYALGAADPAEKPQTVFEGIQNASISMRSVGFGLPA
jgi:4,5-DOPA dioxygenase extradiol